MNVGRVKFFNTEKGFGFVTGIDCDYFTHISKLRSATIEKDNLVTFNQLESNKVKGRFEAIDVEIITVERAEKLLGLVSQKETKILIDSFPSAFERFLNYKASEHYLELEHRAMLYQISFDKYGFAEKINAKISTSMRKKPGDDDSFSAHIVSEYLDGGDKYLKSLDPKYREETYRDYGFYSCYSMQDDYNREQRANDEKKLPEIQKLLQTNFLNSYNADEHRKVLIDTYLDTVKAELRITMSNQNGA